ncbi:MAG: hypothetical protein AAF711_06565 [Planctomycetota bacterium]
MEDKAGAFVKGGLGCLAAFLVIGLCAVVLGGSMHIDAGGACCLFVGGGLLGLLVLWIYNKGKQDGGGHDY